MQPTLESELAPRYDLQEKPARKYEPMIAEALRSSPVYHRPEGCKARTWMLRFKDAVLAFKRYGYKSEHWLPDANLGAIKAYETTDGRVKIINTAIEAQRVAKPRYEAKDTLRIAELVKQLEESNDTVPQVVYFDTPEELQFLQSFESQGRNVHFKQLSERHGQMA